MRKTVLFAANRGYALLNSRRELIERFLEKGWRVILATADDKESQELVALGAVLEPVIFYRSGFSLMADLRAGWRLRKIIRHWAPSLVHLFHAKPVMMGTLAARWKLGRTVRIVNTITGLGHAFMAGGIVTFLFGIGYRVTLPRADMTIFQNRDDLALFVENRWVPEQNAKLIMGSGVLLKRFPYFERAGRDASRPVVIMLGRLLNTKGIREFAEVARQVRKVIPGACFCLAGEEEPNHPDAVDINWLRSQPDIEYLGRLSDVVPLFEKADLLVFTSYREGVPRVVMEAAATGLAAVAFDVPGVREVIRDSETGYLVSVRDVGAMTGRVLELLRDEVLRQKIGLNANALARSAFDIRAVQQAYLDAYRQLGVKI